MSTGSEGTVGAPTAEDRPSGAFVTGGAQGIGRAIVTALARRGDTVFAADLDLEGAEATATALRDEGLDVRARHVDVADVEATAETIAAADDEAALGTLVNNAGVGFRVPLLEVTPSQFDRLMGINLRGVYFALQAAARCMVPRGQGAIVNLASTSGFMSSSIPMTIYDTSKGAVRMLTVTAARELARSGIRVNAVAPGTIDTELTRSVAEDDEALAKMAALRIPMGHLGKPQDIAAAVAWLSSPAAGYVTGHTLVVDGGRLT